MALEHRVDESLFSYRPLNQALREIRLVQLSSDFQFTKDGEMVPSLKLHHTFLDTKNSPQYVALSYNWGTGPKAVVLVEDEGRPAREIVVSANLLDALCHFATLSDQNLDAVRRTFWVDQLCINQTDNDEKSHQVRMMTDIFSQAEMTYAWLGRRGNTLNYEFVGNYDQDLSFIDDVIDSDPNLQHDDSSASQRVDQVLNELYEDDCKQLYALTNFCLHPWFARAWVIQEVVNSKKVIVHWEDGNCEWSKILNLWYLLYWLSKRINIHSTAAVDMLYAARDTLQMTVSYNLRSRTYPLIEIIELMLRCGKTRATKPEDLLYSMMGIASDRDTCGIRVDYGKHYTNVFKEAALLLLKAIGAPALAWSGQQQRNLDSDGCRLPSWVPDLRLSFGFMLHEPIIGHRDRVLPKLFAATKDLAFEYTIGKTDETLAIRTSYVDRIIEVKFFDFTAANFTKRASNPLHYQTWTTRFGRFLDITAHRFPARYDNTTREEMQWRIPIADRYFDGQYTRRAGVEVKDWYMATLRSHNLSSPSVYSKGTSYERLLFGKGHHVVFLTATGYVGLANPSTIAGDEVHLVQGSEIPFIIRKTDSRYELVGETYVHGIMDGELVDDNTKFEWLQLH